MSENASAEAVRIVRSLVVQFPSGPEQTGSAFVAGVGKLATCAHVVTNPLGQRPKRIIVRAPSGLQYDATVGRVEHATDLAILSTSAEKESPPRFAQLLPAVGRSVVFAGLPQGVARLSVFPGMVSAVGGGLITKPKIDLIQVAGMVNNGNSGGPLLDAASCEVLGVMTAKYVPLLHQIDKLRDDLEAIPQFPSAVGINGIDFSTFVNVTIRSMWQLAAVLRLVQVGTGWAVPSKFLLALGV